MVDSHMSSPSEQDEGGIDPIYDIIDYLIRCANISFKNSHLNKPEVRTREKIEAAYELYTQSPTQFLLQFGKYLSPNHIEYFETIQSANANKDFKACIQQLKQYHSNDCINKRIRNRRYKAMQKLQDDTDYFSEKQMMYRNPLLYEQLVGQYLTDEEKRERDGVDNENLTFLSMILETVDRNEMRETKNKQLLMEDATSSTETVKDEREHNKGNEIFSKGKQWGDFDIPDTRPSYMPEPENQAMINANERNLLREEFLQEMYSSFIEGRDIDFDYDSVDHNEDYDDLQQISQDAEDKYFDSEDNDAETLEDHMQHAQDNKRKNSNLDSDPLDVFMQHISNKLQQAYIIVLLLSLLQSFDDMLAIDLLLLTF